MPLRTATWQDLLPASKVLAAAFESSELFGQYMHPYRKKYPDDLYLFFLNMLRSDYYSGPDHHLIVTYNDDNTDKAGSITGVAHWTRKRAQKRSPGVYNQVGLKAIDVYNYLESFIYPNRAADQSKLDVLDRMEPFTEHHWTGTRAEVWYLAIIGVDPSAERRGYGKALVKYGFDLAKAEGVGCSVIAAPGRANFYEACGFDVNVGTTADEGGEENPLGHAEIATIHFWDNGIEPKGVKKYGEK
jgi:GNAT superfamily N-acetyltransferase